MDRIRELVNKLEGELLATHFLHPTESDAPAIKRMLEQVRELDTLLLAGAAPR